MRRALSILLLLLCQPTRASLPTLGALRVERVASAPLLAEGLHPWQVRAPLDRALNLVVVAEAYPAAQGASFVLDAQRLARVVEASYAAHVESINWFLLYIASRESGADKPGQIRDTVWGAYYNALASDGKPTRRVIGCDPDAWHRIAELIDGRLPHFTAILLVNDAEYGGGGGMPVTVSTHADSGRIGAHELAHGFAKVRDEYAINDPWPAPNIALSLAAVPWQDLIDAGVVGQPVKIQTGRWRSGRPCLMQSLSVPTFCPPCARAVASEFRRLTGLRDQASSVRTSSHQPAGASAPPADD